MLLSSIKNSLKILDVTSRRRFLFLVGIQAIVGLLDTIGLFILSLLILNSNTNKNLYLKKIQSIIGQLKVDSIVFSYYVGLVVITFFLLKTFLSIFFLRLQIHFLSRQGVFITEKIMRDYFFILQGYSKKINSQKLVSALNEGVNRITIGILGSVSSLISEGFFLLIIGIFLFFINFNLVLIFIPLYGFSIFSLYRFSNKASHQMGIQKAETDVEISKTVQNLTLNFREIYVRNQLNFFFIKIRNLKIKNMKALGMLWFYPNVGKYAIELVLIFGALFTGLYFIISNSAQSALPEISIFLVAALRLAPSILKIQQSLLFIRSAAGEAIETFNLLEFNRIPISGMTDSVRSAKLDFPDLGTCLFLESVSFKYDLDKGANIFTNLDLIIDHNKLVTVTGQSGVGKSTLIDLMLGILEPTSGHIRLFGLPPRDAIKKFPGLVAYVPQNIFLDDVSVFENVAFGIPFTEIDRNRVEYCLNKVKLLDRLKLSGHSLIDPIGEFGSKLSGGQRQMLAIARALYMTPKLLIMDETTSSLDEDTEEEIVDLLLDLKKDMTILCIAHKGSLLKKSDVIINLD